MDINLFKFKLLVFSSRSIITQSDFKKAIYPEIVSTLLLHSKKTKQRVFILLEIFSEKFNKALYFIISWFSVIKALLFSYF